MTRSTVAGLLAVATAVLIFVAVIAAVLRDWTPLVGYAVAVVVVPVLIGLVAALEWLFIRILGGDR